MTFHSISFDQVALALMTCLAVREVLLYLRERRAERLPAAPTKAPQTSAQRSRK
ncbi:hypothetical protein AQS8620_01118 [Aquimixticola soesokkakensis]|uniref:Uncharacterized protein n=1 Tax=Aquimixticola soesokkakensis TaxID=1519096 RepID=A0A1Y5S5H5_9RHOB|nr:hypothetical protein [Aquimixticola soesokkakensis]SLN32940.1 hypothetical protein AQS8620_01118 [Aquimixticola soesokkakensis]